MPRITVTYATQHQPRCPFCQVPLCGRSTVFIEHVAVCPDCCGAQAILPLHMLDAIRNNRRFANHVSWSRGLWFYAPRPDIPTDKAAWLVH